MTDIAELFTRDPNLCSKQDILAIVMEFRSKAALFRAGVMTAGNTKPKAPSKIKPGVKLDLNDLGI